MVRESGPPLNKLPCDEVWPDDGRENDGKDHKGDWGSHSHAGWIVENQTEKFDVLVIDKTKTKEQ